MSQQDGPYMYAFPNVKYNFIEMDRRPKRILYSEHNSPIHASLEALFSWFQDGISSMNYDIEMWDYTIKI